MIKPGDIQRIANRTGVRDGQIEKDYILTWILYGIAGNQFLSDQLVFKGGTVLKKAYFPDYRFSEDLDFTLADDSVTDQDLLAEFQQVFEWIREEANIPMEIKGEPQNHPASGSLKFYITYSGPLGGDLGRKEIKVDLTRGETMIFDPVKRPVFSEYADIDDLSFSLNCYPLPEVQIEKMAALMGRTIPRDLYDLWYLSEYEDMSLSDHWFEFERKATDKGHDPNEFLSKVESKMETWKRQWKASLATQIRDLPDFDEVWRDLRKEFRKLEK